MKKIVLLFPILFICQLLFSQRLDLIVRTNGDSIACRIDSITISTIYLEIKSSNKWISADLPKTQVKEFQYGVINPDFYNFKPRTSAIESNRKHPNYTLQNVRSASLEELEFYLAKAIKIKKSGAALSIGGSLSAAAGFWIFRASWSGNSGNAFTAGLGGLTFLAGAVVTIIGVPVLITGSSRVKKIEGIINSKNTGMFIELAPYCFHNYNVQPNHSGVTLRIRF